MNLFYLLISILIQPIISTGLKISPKILEIVLDLIRQNIDVNAIFEIIRACQEDNDRNKKYGRGPGKTS